MRWVELALVSQNMWDRTMGEAAMATWAILTYFGNLIPGVGN